MIVNSNKREKVEFPEGNIVLLDGTVLECYARANTLVGSTASDELALDTTGEYLSIGRKKPTPRPLTNEEQKSHEHDRFINNAFYLLAHKDRILSDSRMFLCPVEVQNGLAYTGTSGFGNPTLGVYIEWWLNCRGAMRVDKDRRRSLVYHLAGSPLSGSNKCSEVYENGETKVVTLSPFNEHWSPFIRINTRYTDAKAKYQHYPLELVLEILHREDNGKTDYALIIENRFLNYEIDKLNFLVSHLTEDRNDWRKRYYDLLVSSNDAKIREFYAEYQALETRAELEMIYLKEQRQALKAELKSGRMDNVAYQKQVTPINKRIKELEFEPSHFASNKLKEIFPNDSVSFSMIEQYIYKRHHEDN